VTIMKMILVGVGNFGYRWYSLLKQDYAQMLKVVVVDRDIQAKDQLDESDPFYTSLVEAIEHENPDFILNATPPAIHGQINYTAFDYKLPVLCEKPISDDYPEAIQMVERATQEKIPFAIAENYRFFPFCRKVKKLIGQRAVGDIASIHIDFYKSFQTEKEYFVNMAHPLLIDVTIHHLDLIRYFTGMEGKRIFAKSYNPRGSWAKNNVSACLWLEMENDIVVSYNGTMVTRALETSWTGNWVIEGTTGAIWLREDQIYLIKNGQASQINDLQEVSSGNCLDEFILSLQEDRPAETCGVDYLKTQGLVHFALQANSLARGVEVDLYPIGTEG
jgi:predicted dehydrogenase